MAHKIVIDPVIRMERHAKISIYLDDMAVVCDARFHSLLWTKCRPSKLYKTWQILQTSKAISQIHSVKLPHSFLKLFP